MPLYLLLRICSCTSTKDIRHLIKLSFNTPKPTRGLDALSPAKTIFSGLASKPVATVFSSLTSKLVVTVSPDLASKPVVGFLVEPQNQGGGVFPGLGLKIGSSGLVICATKSPRQFLGLGIKTKHASVYRLRHKTDRGRLA
jgi:hypothetical protein